jgi:hypothetical protein
MHAPAALQQRCGIAAVDAAVDDARLLLRLTTSAPRPVWCGVYSQMPAAPHGNLHVGLPHVAKDDALKCICMHEDFMMMTGYAICIDDGMPKYIYIYYIYIMVG